MIKTYYNCKVIEFGYGDIGISLAGPNKETDNLNQFVMFPIVPGKIGRDIPRYLGQTLTSIGVDTVLEFHRIDSLDGVIASLVELRENMLKQEKYSGTTGSEKD